MFRDSYSNARGVGRNRHWLMALVVGLSLVGLALLLARPPMSRAATLTVTSNADAGGTCPGADCTLRQAIIAAASGDTINFAAGITNINLTSAELLINKNLTINGPGANLLTVQRSTAPGTPDFRIFRIAFGNFNVTISELRISNGNAPNGIGGAILNSGGPMTIANSTISGNSAGDGGGIYNNGGPMTVTNSTISGNTAGSGNGGGIYNGFTMTIINCTIAGNTAANNKVGGGIYNASGTLSHTNSTISGNSAPGGNGGGIRNSGTTAIVNVTISGNSAAVGGGIDNVSEVNVTSSTISGNSAASGGGVDTSGATLRARNTLIARNTATGGGGFPDINGTLKSQGYNLIGNTSGTTVTGTTTGNQLNVDPKLDTDSSGNPLLKDNGGPTKTIALLSGSTAIDKGDSGGIPFDQRGFNRPVDTPSITNAADGSDIGAYEVQPDQLVGCSEINLVVNNNSDSGAGSLRTVIANACGGSTITFAANVRGAINLTSGELLLNKNLTISGPGANLLSVQRSASAGNFRVLNIAGKFNITIYGLPIANGNAPGDFGGGILNGGLSSSGGGVLTMTNCTISGNSAAKGGGIFNGKDGVLIYNSTISGNSANGGGINNDSGAVNITNSTISGNSASSFGGGIYNFSTLTITNSTITNNTAGSFGGGGISNDVGAVFYATSTIIAKNTGGTGPDVRGALTSQGFNLIGNSKDATISPVQFSDQIGTSGSPVDPLLDSLKDNGGATFTHALLSGSPAIDKGDSVGSSTDQRGFTRPFDNPNIANASGGDGSDIGAFEVQAAVPTKARSSRGSSRRSAASKSSATRSKSF